jgi:hypothetical protein
MTKDPRAEPDGADDPGQLSEPEAKPEPRSTLVPSFDVATFARAVDVSQPRAATLTITNETELEEARQRSMQSSLPPARERAHSEAELELSTADVAIDDLRLSTPGELRPRPIATPGEIQLDPEVVLGDLRRIPKLLVTPDAVPGLGLDHHAGFMLALVDSVLSYDTILDVCGMPRKEALAVLAKLVHRKIIGA